MSRVASEENQANSHRDRGGCDRRHQDLGRDRKPPRLAQRVVIFEIRGIGLTVGIAEEQWNGIVRLIIVWFARFARTRKAGDERSLLIVDVLFETSMSGS